MKPLIGITANISPAGDPGRSFASYTDIHYIHREYLDFVARGCGSGVLISPVEVHDRDGVESLLQRLDGILLSGGADVDPARYGETNSASVGCSTERDEFELNLVQTARRLGLPILGVCRGAQVLNVAFGGSLHQDIGDSIGKENMHPRNGDGHEQFHRVVRIADAIGNPRIDAILDVLLPAGEAVVNSSHHQAVKNPGDGLVIAATATDGVAEVIASREDSCILGVQWHPERMREDRVQNMLASWFVKQCAEMIRS